MIVVAAAAIQSLMALSCCLLSRLSQQPRDLAPSDRADWHVYAEDDYPPEAWGCARRLAGIGVRQSRLIAMDYRFDPSSKRRRVWDGHTWTDVTLPEARSRMGKAALAAAAKLDWSDHVARLRTLFAELAA